MSFVENNCQQISFWDNINNLSDREKHYLELSWAVPFSEIVFPAINEQPYEVLYSNKHSRPNTPVNIIIGALILKELNKLTDEGLMYSLMFDIRYQVALHTTSFAEQPISDRTLSRFRARCLSYQRDTGIDLIHNTMCELSDKIASIIEADRTLLRMDSLMIESNIKHLSRLELIYKCTKNALKHVDAAKLPDALAHFLDTNDYNNQFYHNDSLEESILNDAYAALEFCESNSETDLLIRVLDEQTERNEAGIALCGKETLHSQILQSPYDPDATFRHKLKDDHVGYVANILECRGNSTTVILDYQYEKNIYHDSHFLKDAVSKMGEQNTETLLVTDGGYCGSKNVIHASKKNIRLVTTNLTGKKPSSFREYRKTDEFRKLSCFRNGVEAIPSLLRRKYNVDHMPVRGKLRTGFFFAFKICAINISKLCSFLQSSSCCASTGI